LGLASPAHPGAIPALREPFLESAPGHRNPKPVRPCCRAAPGCPHHPNRFRVPYTALMRLPVRGPGAASSLRFAAGMDPDLPIRRSAMTNLVILVGRIARDPETRTTTGGTDITSVSVVTDRPARKEGKTYKDENGFTAKDSEFHRVTCFNGLG